ncbi:hypothetical protein Tco_0585448 [Tanacetum coccineum]
MFLNMDQLEKQLDNKEFQEIGSMASFKESLDSIFQEFCEAQEQADTSSRSGYVAHVVDLQRYKDLIYIEEPLTEVQTTAEIKLSLLQRQQHTEQPEFNMKERLTRMQEQCHDYVLYLL